MAQKEEKNFQGKDRRRQRFQDQVEVCHKLREKKNFLKSKNRTSRVGREKTFRNLNEVNFLFQQKISNCIK